MSARARMAEDLVRMRDSGRVAVLASKSAPATAAQQKSLHAKGLFALEFRYDLADSGEAAMDGWGKCQRNLPVLFTCRSVGQGGRDSSSEAQKERLLARAANAFQGVDLESSMSRSAVAGLVDAARQSGCMALFSHHDFSGKPDFAQLAEIAGQGFESGADAVKIAAQADTPEAFATMLSLQSRHAAENLAVLCMGRFGALSRALFPCVGALFTFASVGERTAQGQMDLGETLRHAVALRGLVS